MVLDNIPQWIWFILEVIIAPLFFIFIEHKFSITQRMIRLYHILINSKSALELTIWIESDSEFKEIKDSLISYSKAEIEKIKKDNNDSLELKLKNYDLVLKKHNTGIYILETDKIRGGIRDIKSDLRQLVSKISKMNNKKLIGNIKNISLDLYLPYAWKYINSLEPKGYSLNNCEVVFKDNNGCSVNINMEKTNFKNVPLEQLTDVLNDFTSIF